MNVVLIVILALTCIGALVATAVLLDLPIPGTKLGSGGARNSMRAIVSAQRQAVQTQGSRATSKRDALLEQAEEAKVHRVSSSKLTLRKKLKFAQWKMPVVVFRALQIGISLFVAGLASTKFNLGVVALSLSAGPMIMGWLLTSAVEKRFKAFDADYPQFLLSLVGLLKTGMNAMGALEAAAQGLEEGSMVRSEVQVMLERLRFGVSEDRSIGSFGEDIYHPEIELFVQALLLSRRVGGTLSDTLERLSKQVRKRQFFRASAAAAVGMQRGSIWFILAILVGLEVYMYFIYPEAVTGAWADKTAWEVWQVGGILIFIGMFWVRQVTKIRT